MVVEKGTVQEQRQWTAERRDEGHKPPGRQKFHPDHLTYRWIKCCSSGSWLRFPNEIRACSTLHMHLKEMRMSSFHLHSGATDGKWWRKITCVANFILWTRKHQAYPTITSLPFHSWEPFSHFICSFIHSCINFSLCLCYGLNSVLIRGHSSEKNKIFTFGELAFLKIFYFSSFFLVSKIEDLSLKKKGK